MLLAVDDNNLLWVMWGYIIGLKIREANTVYAYVADFIHASLKAMPRLGFKYIENLYETDF